MTHPEIRMSSARQLFSSFAIRISFVIWISLFVIRCWLGVIALITLRILPSRPMDGRQQTRPPKGEQHEHKSRDGTPREAAAQLRIFPAHDHQRQIQQPNKNRPKDFGVAVKVNSFNLLEPDGAD